MRASQDDIPLLRNEIEARRSRSSAPGGHLYVARGISRFRANLDSITSAAALNDLSLVLGHGSMAYGLDIDTPTGNISLGSSTLTSNGPISDTAARLIASQGSIGLFGVSIDAASTAGIALSASAVDNVSVTGSTVLVGGNLNSTGVALLAQSALMPQNDNLTFKGTSADASSLVGGSVSVSGLALVETGAISGNAFSAQSKSGNVSISSTTVTLGSSTGDGITVVSKGDANMTGSIYKEAGMATVGGVVLTSQGNLTASNDSITLGQGTNGQALQASSAGGDVVLSNDTIAVKGPASIGLLAFAKGTTSLTGTSVVMNGGASTAVLLQSGTGEQLIENNTFSTSGQGTGKGGWPRK
jgi:hypothetical protein